MRLQPDLVYRNGRFESGVAVSIDEVSGRITGVGPAGDGDGQSTQLSGCVLLPGMVNAHSHAFQRAIRGHTQWKPRSTERADFWSWREAMYAAVLPMTPEDVYAVSRFAFIEMLLAGYTTVGEFHYLQCAPDGSTYDDPNELHHAVIRAARDAGIRIVLINVAYARGGIGKPLRPEQRRFATADLDAFLAATDQLLAETSESATISVGISPHSVRAVERSWLRPIAEFGARAGIPVHMHLSEQPAEVESCIAAYGMRPIELAAAERVLSPAFTAIHATHVTDAEIGMLAGAGASVCVCPTTERDLGDGIARADTMLEDGVRMCIGTDSQTVIDPWEEIRCLEYHKRLARLERIILARGQERLELGGTLLEIGSANGARSLDVSAGRIEKGSLADLVAIDLEHHGLSGWAPASLEALLALGCPLAAVRDVWVGGQRVVTERRHVLLHDAKTSFESVVRRVLG